MVLPMVAVPASGNGGTENTPDFDCCSSTVQYRVYEYQRTSSHLEIYNKP